MTDEQRKAAEATIDPATIQPDVGEDYGTPWCSSGCPRFADRLEKCPRLTVGTAPTTADVCLLHSKAQVVNVLSLTAACKAVIDADSEGHRMPGWLVHKARAALAKVAGQ